MSENENLYILWTNPDIHTSRFMMLMYARNSMLRGWWKRVTVIVWGGTAALVAENPVIQEEIIMAQQAGVKFSACVACATQLGVTGTLEELGIEVKPWGQPLTELLQSGEKLITL